MSSVSSEASVVQLAASKIALLIGLHEFGSVAETVLEYVYQHHEHLLERDAKTLGLTLVSKEDELGDLVGRTGDALAPQFLEIMKWAENRRQPVTQATAATLLETVDELVSQAHGKRKLKAEDAQEVKRQLSERIRLSYGSRNEDLAIRAYERQTGSSVRLTNQHFYTLQFPRLRDDSTVVATDFNLIEKKIKSVKLDRGGGNRRELLNDDSAVDNNTVDIGSESCDGAPYFTICGMIDGVADSLEIVSDDNWELNPVLIEVKNRLRGFRLPPPLHEYIQMAIYFKMIGLTKGDLVQCLHADRTQIHVTRVSMGEFPLRNRSSSMREGEDSLWSTVILPRLYALVQAIKNIRYNDTLRLAFLNGSDSERIALLKQECDFI